MSRYFKRHYKASPELARPHSTIEFAGQRHMIVEIIEGDRGSVRATGLTFFESTEGWEPSTAEEWLQAVAGATKAERKRQAEREARRDGEAYGFEVKVSARFGARTSDHIVRATATTLIANGGAVYSRKDGRQRGRDRYNGRWIERDSLAAIEEFLAGRVKVDIVAERKAAAL